jgi:hypothetical protein
MATKGISFGKFGQIVRHPLRARKAVMGHGPHGIGKSMVVYQLAPKMAEILCLNKDEKFVETWGADYVYPVVERRVSQMADVGEIVGVPNDKETVQFVEGNKDTDIRVTQATPMKWYAQACVQPCILFLDEPDRGSNDVTQALMELTDSRKIWGVHLHPDTIVISMANGGAHDENNVYQVNEMDPAVYSRWWHVNLEPTQKDWLDWAKDNVHPLIWEFINDNRSHLEHTGEFEPNKVYPDRRSWHHFSDAIMAADEAEEGFVHPGKDGENLDIYFVGEGYVGQEAATAFMKFVQKYEANVSVEDVLSGKQLETIKKMNTTDANAMVDKLVASDQLKNGLNDEQMLNVGKFIYNISGELAMKAWEKVTDTDAEAVVKLWEKEVEEGVAFGAYIGEIIMADKTDK